MLGFLTSTQREYVLLTLELGHVLARPLYGFQCSSILCLRGISWREFISSKEIRTHPRHIGLSYAQNLAQCRGKQTVSLAKYAFSYHRNQNKAIIPSK